MPYSETVSQILDLFEEGASKSATSVKILHEDAVSMSLQFRLNSETHRIKAISVDNEWSVQNQR